MPRLIALLALAISTASFAADPVPSGYYEVKFQNGRIEYGQIESTGDRFKITSERGTSAPLPWSTVAAFTERTSAAVLADQASRLLSSGNEQAATELAVKAVQSDSSFSLAPELNSLVNAEQDRAIREQSMRRTETMNRIFNYLDRNAPDSAIDIVDAELSRSANDQEFLSMGVRCDMLRHKLSLKSAAWFTSDYADRLRDINPEAPILVWLEQHKSALMKMAQHDGGKKSLYEQLLEDQRAANHLERMQKVWAAERRAQDAREMMSRASSISEDDQESRYIRKHGAQMREDDERARNAILSSGYKPAINALLEQKFNPRDRREVIVIDRD